MFEQATLSTGPAANRAWTAFAGIACQAVMAIGLLVSPMLFPQALPKVVLSVPSVFTSARANKPEVKPESSHIIAVRPVPFHLGALFEPRQVPDKTALIEDTGFSAPSTGTAAFLTGIGGDGQGNVIGALPALRLAVAPPIPVVEPPKAPPPSAIPARVPVGGRVKLAEILHRVEPVYPPLAKQARISGTVELEGIIGVDGRMIDLRVKSGHPLLTKAAYDAVIQWVYRPTTLNDKPVEVIAPITVSFRLN